MKFINLITLILLIFIFSCGEKVDYNKVKTDKENIEKKVEKITNDILVLKTYVTKYMEKTEIEYKTINKDEDIEKFEEFQNVNNSIKNRFLEMNSQFKNIMPDIKNLSSKEDLDYDASEAKLLAEKVKIATEINTQLESMFEDVKKVHYKYKVNSADVQHIINEIKEGKTKQEAILKTGHLKQLNEVQNRMKKIEYEKSNLLSSNTVIKQRYNSIKENIDKIESLIEKKAKGEALTDSEEKIYADQINYLNEIRKNLDLLEKKK